jgi:hypothetical protein
MELFMIAAILTGLFYALRNIVSKYVIANRMQAIEWYLASALN